MNDKYITENNPFADCGYDIWEVDEHGVKVRRVTDEVKELNRLERLVTDSVNSAHLTDRTHVQHAFLKERLTKKFVDDLMVVPEPPTWFDAPRNIPSYESIPVMTIRKDQWNRMVRILKELAERFLLP